MTIKYRTVPEANYRSVFNTKTLQTMRFKIDQSKNFGSLKYPEILDLSCGTRCNMECSYCLEGNTEITLSSGNTLKIEDISVGDNVITINENTNNVEIHVVSQVHTKNYNDFMFEIELESGEILKMTKDHKVFTKNRGYVEAQTLMLEDDLVLYNEYS